MYLHKFRTFDYKKSLYVKDIMSLIIAGFIILFCMGITSIYYSNLYKKHTTENYQNSLELYCSYWDNELETINNSLVSMTANIYDDSYLYVCNTKDRLTLETSKITLMKQMSGVAYSHGNKILVFTYIPERNIYLKSNYSMIDLSERKLLDLEIQDYINKRKGYNSTTWETIECGQSNYFINIYQVSNGYVGALVNCNTILSGLVQGDQIVKQAEFRNDSKNIIYYSGIAGQADNKAYSSFSLKMSHILYNIEITVIENKLFSDSRFLLLIAVVATLIGITVMSFIAQFQMKVVLRPLNRLKNGMESFSEGKLSLRLEEDNSSNEINTLYKTFNNMAEQISKLKIEVYEFEIEKQKIQRDFLRIQIQPHFYTNILNLIYGFAELRDYNTIQKLSKTTAGYFRYLMGEKGTFVLLKEEFYCIKNYIEIQKFRYIDCLEIQFDVEEGMEKQLILPMILHTFVENSVKHNITLVPKLEVKIQVRKAHGKLYMRIWDNGIGFPEQILNRLAANQNISVNGEHIGIINVKERLKMFYQEDAFINISSRPGSTLIEIVMPQIMTEEENTDEHTSGR